MVTGFEQQVLSFFGNSELLLAIFLVWSLVWKGFALWRSVKKNNKYWFIAILLLNTAGILEILYYFIFSEMGKNKKTSN
jgi:hypothetical protein